MCTKPSSEAASDSIYSGDLQASRDDRGCRPRRNPPARPVGRSAQSAQPLHGFSGEWHAALPKKPGAEEISTWTREAKKHPATTRPSISSCLTTCCFTILLRHVLQKPVPCCSKLRPQSVSSAEARPRDRKPAKPEAPERSQPRKAPKLRAWLKKVTADEVLGRWTRRSSGLGAQVELGQDSNRTAHFSAPRSSWSGSSGSSGSSAAPGWTRRSGRRWRRTDISCSEECSRRRKARTCRRSSTASSPGCRWSSRRPPRATSTACEQTAAARAPARWRTRPPWRWRSPSRTARCSSRCRGRSAASASSTARCTGR